MPAGIGYPRVVGLSPDKRAEFESVPSGLASLMETPVSTGGINPTALAGPMKVSNPTPLPTGAPALDFRRDQQALSFANGGLVPANAQAAAAAAPPAQIPLPQMEAEVQRLSQQSPEVVQQIQQALSNALQSGNLTMEQLNMAVEMARAAAQNPELYPRLRQLAIQQGLVDEDELPAQYDQGIVMAMLLAGAAVQQSVGGTPSGSPQLPPAQFGNGGFIPPEASADTTGVADDITIKVSGGEFVIPEDIVRRKGTEFFEKLIGADVKKA